MKFAISLIFILLLFAAASTPVYGCRIAVQCDYCQIDAQFQNVALSETPRIPPGEDLIQCDAFIMNLPDSELRLFAVSKGHEPGFTYQWASEQDVPHDIQNAFDDFTGVLGTVETLQPIEIPPSIAPSAYLLPRDTSIESAIDDYIRSNHWFWNRIYTTFGALNSAIGVIGLDFSGFLTVMVVFADGSFGLFTLESIGTFSEWRAENSSFQDADGNTIFFEPEDYDNQSGFASGSTIDRLVTYLERSGWNVVRNSDNSSGGAPRCRWVCDDVDEWQCTVDCSSP